MNKEWQDCFFCGLDIDIDDNPEWDRKKVLATIEDKYSTLEDGELFWCCVACEGFLNVSEPI